MRLTRRRCLGVFAASVCAFSRQANQAEDKDWVCPMHPGYRSDKPGVCPRCGMKLILGVPDRVEYPLEIAHTPDVLRPNETARLTLRAYRPGTNQIVRDFEIVHEKLIHLFVVGENLAYFAHVHPVPQPDGSFVQEVKLPHGGMYRLLADFYPAGSVPQLAVGTIFVQGAAPKGKRAVSFSGDTCKAENTSARLRMDPELPVAGLETKLFYTLEPGEELQPYLGAWAHMLAASSDLIDLMHLHPFLADGNAQLQFNVIFPREGLYGVWTQIQRAGLVNTFAFTIPVKSL